MLPSDCNLAASKFPLILAENKSMHQPQVSGQVIRKDENEVTGWIAGMDGPVVLEITHADHVLGECVAKPEPPEADSKTMRHGFSFKMPPFPLSEVNTPQGLFTLSWFRRHP